MIIKDLQIAIQVVDFIFLFYFLGLLTIKAFILPRDVFLFEKIHGRWQQNMLFSLVVITVTALGLLLVRVMLMSGESTADAIELIPTVINKTHYGAMWSIHLLAILFLWLFAAFAAIRGSKIPVYLMLITSLIVTWTYSATSHAADQGDFSFSEINDWIHMLTTAIWGGSIIAGCFFVFPVTKRLPASSLTLAASMKRLSDLLLVTVPVVLLTGITNVVEHTHNYALLLTHTYGCILALKLLFVCLMLFVGAHNRSRIKADVVGNHTTAKLHVNFNYDVVFLGAAIVCAAILTQTMPS